MKYIDAEKLIAEIKRKRDSALERQKNLEKIGQETVLNEMIAAELNRLISFVTSHQQEQPECCTVEEWMQHIKNADQLTKDIFSKGPYDVLYDALNHPFLHCYNAIKEFGELCFQTGVKSVKQEQPVEIHIDNSNIQKFDPNIKVEIHTDETGDIDGKAMLYVADKSYKIGFRDGKASKEQSVIKKSNALFDKCVENCDPAVMKEVSDNIDKMLGRQPVEGLEEEYKDYVENDPVYSKLVNRNAGLGIARHFAEWGAEHLKK